MKSLNLNLAHLISGAGNGLHSILFDASFEKADGERFNLINFNVTMLYKRGLELASEGYDLIKLVQHNDVEWCGPSQPGGCSKFAEDVLNIGEDLAAPEQPVEL